jgi:major membrane immunogen (membrane-anchored lipoprotein)
MKKTVLLSLILLSGVLLTACGKNDEVVVDDITTDVALTDCQKAINKYLDGADKSGK